MAEPENDYPLSERVRARLDELGLSIMEWKRRSGVSDATLRRIREGERFSVPKERAAERGLGWAPGSFDSVRAGGEPTLAFNRSDVTSGGKAITGLSEAEWAVLAATLAALRKADT